ncbi:MAG: WS/DGAT domain-containing protein [Actinobacteria bacterium]|nr:WS/DGAT domain-containing protein [Actinomycetota bacterium]
MADSPTFDNKMSDAEGLMWRMEKDPHLSSTFANVTILDKRPDMDRIMRTMERATHVVPRLRQRVQPAPANLTAPMWVDDANFDLKYHVRHIALPKPGNLRQLLDLASIVTADPFDRTRPLWQFTLVEGLRGGKCALIQKLHHTITDGEGGVKLSLEFLDFAADTPERPPHNADDIAVAREQSQPSSSETLRDLVAGSLRMPLGLLRQVRELLADPTQLPEAGTAAADTIRGIISQLSDLEQAHSPLWTQRSLRRQIEVLQAPYAETRAVAAKLGGKLNTAFLTVAAEASSRYHIALGAPVDTLRASMAISTRGESSGANAFSLARIEVPTAAMSVAERFIAINEASQVARESAAPASLETLAAVASTLPTSLVTRLARTQAHTIDFATSNVRGAPVALFLGGAQVLQNYPVGPLGGVAFNLTLLSYMGSLDMGANIDTAAVADPALLHRCLVGAFKDLLAI